MSNNLVRVIDARTQRTLAVFWRSVGRWVQADEDSPFPENVERELAAFARGSSTPDELARVFAEYESCGCNYAGCNKLHGDVGDGGLVPRLVMRDV